MIFFKNVFVLFVFIVVFLSKAYCVAGFGDWQIETPYQNTIENYSGSGITLRLKHLKAVHNMSKWYFYHAHIIGKREKGYFIVDEINNKVYLFEKEEDWQKAIEEANLKPWVITRWHEGGEGYLFTLILLFVFGGFTIMLPLVFLYFYAIYVAICEGFKLRNPLMTVIFGAPLAIGIPYLLELFPQSF